MVDGKNQLASLSFCWTIVLMVYPFHIDSKLKGWSLGRFQSLYSIYRSLYNIYLSVYLPIYLPIYLSTYLLIYLSTYLSNYLSTYFTYLPISQSTYLSVSVYIHLLRILHLLHLLDSLYPLDLIHLTICLSVSQSVSLFIYKIWA